MAETHEPIAPAELDQLFAAVRAAGDNQRFALAVSGGSDSTALMVLLAEWRDLQRQSPPLPHAFSVVTVDHALRSQAAAEAIAVARRAADLGFNHDILHWNGPKPHGGLQAAARAARYALLGEHARANGIGTVVTAHTADDQAETLLMRLARGSGLDGLSGMAVLSQLPDPAGFDRPPVRLLRPFLGVRKARLQASLRQRGIGWMEDPSNASPAFERVRLRAARAHLKEVGLSVAALGRSAQRLQSARVALEAWVGELFQPELNLVRVDPCGFFAIALPRLKALPREVVLRLLGRAMAAAGGSAEPVPQAGLEAIAEHLLGPKTAGGWTLARAKITLAGDRVLIEREPGREALPHLSLLPGQSTLWDGRFHVVAGAGLQQAVELRALDLEGTREVRRLDLARDLSAVTLRALPGFWRGLSLLAVPPLGFWRDDSLRAQLSAAFVFAASIGAPD